MNERSEFDSLEPLAEDFVERLRRGERPSIEDYAKNNPEAASRIREVFPALAAMEGVAAVLSENGPAASDTKSTVEAVPDQIGDYRILREVGRGGMGIVYEAEQVSLGRHVALKVLLPQLQSRPRFLERFRREARAAGRLHHTNIVPVFGVGESDGNHFFVMQYITGVGLDQVIDDVRRLRGDQNPSEPSPAMACEETLSISVAQGLLERQSNSETPANAESRSTPTGTSQLVSAGGYHRSAAGLVLQAARALAHAHGHGIIHRDVKPSNLLLDLQGNLWVTDFGLAKTDEASDLTGSHDVLGTVRYMSPERFEGKAIDRRADIYALGLTLYEMLTLRAAFPDHDRIQLMRLIAQGTFRRPREIDPSIPRDLETIVLKSVAVDPKHRYRTADEVADDLELFIANRPIKSRRVSNWEHLQRWARRNPVVSGLSATVAFLLVAVSVISLVSNARLGKTNRDLDSKTIAIEKSLVEQEKLWVQAQDEAWHARIESARAWQTFGRRGQRFEGLQNLRKALELDPKRDVLRVRNEAVGCLALPDVDVMREFDWPEGSINAVFSPDMTKYARNDKDGNISVRSATDDSELFAIPTQGLIDDYGGLSFSPDGRYLWRCCKESIWLWRIAGPSPVEVLFLDNCSTAAFTTDGKQLLASNREGQLRIYDLDDTLPSRDRKPNRVLDLPADSNGFLVPNPVDSNLILLTGVSTITVFDLKTGIFVHRRAAPENARVWWTAWHPEGKYYAVGDTHRVWVCSGESDAIISELDLGNAGGFHCWFNPSGDRLWTSDWSGRNRIWDWKARRLVFDFYDVCTLPTSISGDGTTLVSVKRGNRLQLLRIAEGLEACKWPTSRLGRNDRLELSRAPMVSGDGRLLVCSCSDGLALFDALRRELISFLPFFWVHPLGFTPDQQGLWFASTSNSGSGDDLNLLPISCCGDRIEIGKPHRVMSMQSGSTVPGLSPDGRVLIALGSKGPLSGATLYQDVGKPNATSTFLGKQTAVRYCSVSPDGTWVISGTHGSGNGKPSITLWNATTHERVKDLENWGGTSGFSADGRWAWTVHSDYRQVRIWDTKNWQSVSAFPGTWAVFSPDARFLAVGGVDTGVVRLVRVPDGQEVVRLSVPANVLFNPGCFTPDGGKFIAVVAGQWYLHEWDLHAIRRQLQPLGLDWDDKPIPPAQPGPTKYPAELAVELPKRSSNAVVSDSGPVHDPHARWILGSVFVASQPLHPAGYLQKSVTFFHLNRFDEGLREIDTAIALAPEDAGLYHIRGRICRAKGDLAAAMAAPDRAVELDLDSSAHAERANTATELHRDREMLQSTRKMVEVWPDSLNWQQMLAFAYLVAEPPLRDPAAAIETARSAIQMSSGNPASHTALAYAFYQSGRWEEAEKEFAESHRLRPAPGFDAINLFGLAMCSQKSGDFAKARSWFAMAVVNKDTGRVTGELGKRLFDAVYADAAKALSLPLPKR